MSLTKLMHNQEGVIKYQLDHDHQQLDDSISILEMNAWRTLLYKLRFIGQIEDRYDGFGFGNISQRLLTANQEALNFVVSGTQTGGLETLCRQHYCLVEHADPTKNYLRSHGEIKPSSEALTHASVYLQNAKIRSIIHVHNPEIWNNTKTLHLPYTSAHIPYGTPEMAEAVRCLLQSSTTQGTGIFCMLGHEDGVIAFSEHMENAACTLLSAYTKALILEQKKQ